MVLANVGSVAARNNSYVATKLFVRPASDKQLQRTVTDRVRRRMGSLPGLERGGDRGAMRQQPNRIQ
jgi:hypothetical protein